MELVFINLLGHQLGPDHQRALPQGLQVDGYHLTG